MIIPDWYLIYSLLKEQKKLQEEAAAQMDSIRPERDVTPEVKLLEEPKNGDK